jgi:hypothetical protein
MKKERILGFILLSLCIALTVARFSVPVTNLITWDVFGYYLYLPASFIYHDLFLLDQQWLTQIREQYEPTTTLYQAVQIENGNWVLKYSMGMALLFMPFFFIGHFCALLLGLPADGFSACYQVSLVIGGLVYAFIGLWFFVKVLRHFFDSTIVIILLIIIVLGTNYFQLTAFDGTLLSHNFLFALYTMLVWFTIQWHQNQRFLFSALIGLLCGLIVLVRPSEIVCVFIPILWGVFNKSSLSDKLNLLNKNKLQFVAAIILAILVGLPQIIYWLAVSGKPLFYSYTNAGEGFEFLTPYIWQYLFSFRKGWLIYTPIMIFALVGFYHLYQKQRKVFWAILVFFVVNLWIVSSWTTWWYAGGSFSARSLVPAYVLLAIPLGYFVEWLLARKAVLLSLMGFIGASLILLNLFQTWQFANGIITKESMTAAYYFAIFGKTSVTDADKKLLLIDRSNEEIEFFTDSSDYKRRMIYQNSFHEISLPSPSGDSIGVLVLSGSNSFSPGPNLAFNELTDLDHAWIQTTVRVFIPVEFSEPWPVLVVTFNHKDKTYKYRTSEKLFTDWKKGQWNTIKMDYLTPEVRSAKDNLMIYVWHRGSSALAIDDLEVVLWERRAN